MDYFCEAAAELPVKWRPELIRDLSMSCNTYDHPVNCSPRSKAFLANLIEDTLDKLHLESLLNLPSLLNTFQLDETDDTDESKETLMSKLLAIIE